jgi:hypothetical protein
MVAALDSVCLTLEHAADFLDDGFERTDKMWRADGNLSDVCELVE